MAKTKKNKQVKNKIAIVKFEKAMGDSDANQMSCCRISCFRKLCGFVLGVIIGAAVCHMFFCHSPHGGNKRMLITHFEEKFTNGCLDTSKIEYPELLEAFQLKDLDENGCITKEELSAPTKIIKMMDGETY